MSDEGIHTHPTSSPGVVVGVLYTNMEEDDGVRWGRTEGSDRVWEVNGLCGIRPGYWNSSMFWFLIRIYIFFLIVLVRFRNGDVFGISAACDEAVIERALERGQEESASADERLRFLVRGGRDGRNMENVERAFIDIRDKEDVRS